MMFLGELILGGQHFFLRTPSLSRSGFATVLPEPHSPYQTVPPRAGSPTVDQVNAAHAAML